MDPDDLVFKWCLIKTFQVACSRFTVATTASLASLAPSALTLLWFFLLFFIPPSAFFVKTTHTNAWSTPSCVSPTKKALDFRLQNMSELWDVQAARQNWIRILNRDSLSFCLSTPTLREKGGTLWAGKSNESGCPLRPWQKVWSLKCSLHGQEPLCDNQY